MAKTKRLQEKIEMELKKKITEWRVRYVTRWNRYCNQAFRRLLDKLVQDFQCVFSNILLMNRKLIFCVTIITTTIIISARL